MPRPCRECGNPFTPKYHFHYLCGSCAADKFGWDQPRTGAGFGTRGSPKVNDRGLAVTVTAEFALHVDALIRLCHPDKHDNSTAATETTQWLLTKRDQLKRLEKP